MVSRVLGLLLISLDFRVKRCILLFGVLGYANEFTQKLNGCKFKIIT